MKEHVTMQAGGAELKNKFNRRSYLKHKLRAKFGSQQEGHGRAFLQKKAVVRQHLRLKNKALAKEKKQLHNLHDVCEEGTTETKLQDSPTDTIIDDSPLSSIPRKNRPNNLRRARAAYKKKIEEKHQRREEVTRRKEEAEAAKKRYKEKKASQV